MFESARAKVGRARKHLDFLNTDFARFVGGKPYSIGKELDPETGNTLVVYEPAEIPPCWPLVIGELLYDLRSALDHVVYEIQGPVEKSEFPIFLERNKYFLREKRGEYSKISGMHKIRGITHAEVQRVIEAFQPYNGPKQGTAPEGTALWGLHLLNNIDKHRTLHLCRRQYHYATLRIGAQLTDESRLIVPENLEKRAIVGWLRGVDREVEVDYTFAFQITFDEGEVPAVVGKRVEPICQVFIDQVARIIDRIESVFV